MNINLFEYQNRVTYEKKYFIDLEVFLDDIWSKREKSGFWEVDENDKSEVQRFIQFLYKSTELKSNKYVGVINFQGTTINLLPKIFYDQGREYQSSDIKAINQHILWYLSYCRKLKFPNYQTSLGSENNDFFEVLIYLFSKYTRNLLSNSIYQQYEETSKEVYNIKGRLEVQRYITENLSTGRWHKLNCTYDAFVMDNKFNRIIKYVTNLLFSVTSNPDNKKYLREILFILDEVSEERFTANDCASIIFNPMFEDFETVRDYCTMFLSNSISVNYKNELKLFAFLIPTEYLFEDFVFGFINKEIPEIKATPQNTSEYLDIDNIFRIKPDLCITAQDKKFIADTKYKIIYSDNSDPKSGITQSDLYQMIAYAIRFNIQDVILLYPNTIQNYQKKATNLEVS
jgi:5-methylcytosine-specific restriction enzyme subunit McrC